MLQNYRSRQVNRLSGARLIQGQFVFFILASLTGMKQLNHTSYLTLQAQYQDLGWPVEQMEAQDDFTIFNLAELGQPMPFRSPPSRLNFFVFNFLKSASGHYVVDEQRFAMRPGTIYFTNPGHTRSFEYQVLEEAYLITLSEDFLREHVHPNVFEEFPFLLAETFPALPVAPAVFAEFERIYLQLHQEYRARSPFRQRLIGHLFLVLLLKLNEHFGLDYNPIYEGNRGSAIVRRFRQLLDQHYQDLRHGRAYRMYCDPCAFSLRTSGCGVASCTGCQVSVRLSVRSVRPIRS